ncbi:hypothetical protein [Rhizobium sp. WL3]|uniref:hypothetical protein n=1 Tax=Rhizobium sp. WL3 TaxID=2603277 RepID=UPI00164F006F|nr:hypothetical protein [Rhizobium sp. WL3]
MTRRRGVLLTLAAFAVFSGTDALVKLSAQSLPAPQVTLLVTVAAFVSLGAHAVVTGRVRRLLPRLSDCGGLGRGPFPVQPDHLGLPLRRPSVFCP